MSVKVKCTILLTKLPLVVLLLMKIKYLVLVIQSKKSDYNTKIKEIKNKKNYDKYITIPEFNKFTATKTDFDNKLKDVISNKN